MSDLTVLPKIKRLCFTCRLLTCKHRSELVCCCDKHQPRAGVRA